MIEMIWSNYQSNSKEHNDSWHFSESVSTLEKERVFWYILRSKFNIEHRKYGHLLLWYGPEMTVPGELCLISHRSCLLLQIISWFAQSWVCRISYYGWMRIWFSTHSAPKKNLVNDVKHIFTVTSSPIPKLTLVVYSGCKSLMLKLVSEATKLMPQSFFYVLCFVFLMNSS